MAAPAVAVRRLATGRSRKAVCAFGVQDVPTTPLWMPRRGRDWKEIVDTLYRIARGPEESRVDNNGDALSPIDCDRVVAYAALEGNAEARADVEARFGIRLSDVPPPGD